MPETIFDLKRKLLRERVGIPTNQWDRFYEYLVVDWAPTLPKTPNWEAASLFTAIQASFDGSGTNSPVQVSPYLLHNLAACAAVALHNRENKKIEWSDHCDIVKRTYTGFAHTIIRAIKDGRITVNNDKYFFAVMEIPEWFVTWARDTAVI